MTLLFHRLYGTDPFQSLRNLSSTALSASVLSLLSSGMQPQTIKNDSITQTPKMVAIAINDARTKILRSLKQLMKRIKPAEAISPERKNWS